MPDSLVVDASIAVKWILDEEGSAKARLIFEHAAAGRLTLLAPDILVPEVTNVIWKNAALRALASPERAQETLRVFLRGVPPLVPSSVLAAPALELAMRFRRSLYDCLYVALALSERCTLVTADMALVRTMGPETGAVVALEDVRLER